MENKNKMETEQINKIKEILKEEQKDYNFNDYVYNWIDEEDLKDLDIDDLKDFLTDLNENEEITQAEVIYYPNAMKYLSENDESLRESLELATDLGYELKNINSELLASLLKTENNREDYNNFIDEVINRCEVEFDNLE